MKKLYILILFSVCSFFVKGQYTLTLGSMYVPGDVVLDPLPCTNTIVSLASSGTNQTWNYMSLNVNWVPSSSSNYISMSLVPNATLFPTGTMGASGFPGYATVFENTPTASKQIGWAAPTASDCLVYSNPFTMLTFPFTYGSSFSDTYGYSQTASITSGTINASGDGTGLLLLPGMSHANVLKVHYTYTETTITGTVVSTSNGTYEYFYNSTNKSPLLMIYNVTNVSGTTTATFNGAQVDPYAYVGIAEQKSEVQFNISPNPTSSHQTTVCFESEVLSDYSVLVFNNLGQEVKKQVITPQECLDKKATINLDGLSSGVFYIKLKGKDGETTKKLIIE